MHNNAKDNPSTKRYTVLVDKNLYSRAKAIARKKGMKWYEWINLVLACITNQPYPAYLKHSLIKSKSQMWYKWVNLALANITKKRYLSYLKKNNGNTARTKKHRRYRR